MWKNDISGIYGIKEKETNEILYVGQAVRLKKRKSTHKYDILHRPEVLKIDSYIADKLKNGKALDDFEFIHLEECSQDELNEKENYWLSKLNPKFNILPRNDDYRNLLSNTTREKTAISLSRNGLKGKKLICSEYPNEIFLSKKECSEFLISKGFNVSTHNISDALHWNNYSKGFHFYLIN